jgi:uncharacterized protein
VFPIFLALPRILWVKYCASNSFDLLGNAQPIGIATDNTDFHRLRLNYLCASVKSVASDAQFKFAFHNIRVRAIFLMAICILSCTSRTDVFQNRLSQSTSPYLQEHSDNPVDWYEWGEEALNKAKSENKTLIVSIGYASCHWCHVMEEESFMDTAVARIMNENFVSIKVDREERPDIDQIYINAAQLISGSAGWPLNAFALPDGKPFFAATYFPKEQWLELLQQVLDFYNNDNGNVVKQAEAITKGLQSNNLSLVVKGNKNEFLKENYNELLVSWQSQLDFKQGGLKGSPKFPMPVVWEALLQNHYLTENQKSLEAVTTTLDAMAKGGIYDHLQGGFARYATDSLWRVPHFEKMLYDNGQLISLYSHAYQVTKTEEYRSIINQTLEFVKAELTSQEGGFYSSLNADSEGEEGKFYIWTKAEIEKVVDKKSWNLVSNYFNISNEGNWENGKNILQQNVSVQELAKKYSISVEQVDSTLSANKNALLTVRNNRVHPTSDEKTLTSWNALMLSGYLDAHHALGNPDYLQAALANAKFLEKNMLHKGGKLWRSFYNGQAGIGAFLDDYALLSKAYMKLYEATFDIHWLELSRALADHAVQHFRDSETGLFFYVSDEAEKLVSREMEIDDNVIPSSNSVMADVLFRLGEYYDKDSYKEIAIGMLKKVAGGGESIDPYHANWATVLGLTTHQPFEVAIVGDNARTVSHQLQQHYFPTAIFMGGQSENLPLLENKLVKGKTIIYVCRNKVCKLPVESVGEALGQLKSGEQ